MWGFVAKAAGWAIAHKSEIAGAIQIWKAFRAKRKAGQREDEGTTAYYKRTGLDTVADAAKLASREILESNEQ